MGSAGEVTVGAVRIGGDHPLVLLGGPCAIETEAHALRMAEALVRLTAEAKVPFVYKSSYDKANRSSHRSYRGPGLAEGLQILARVREEFGCPVLSDVHLPSEVGPAAEMLDILQIPASSAGRPTWSWPAGRAAGRSTSRRGSSWPPGTWGTSSPSSARPATPRSS